MDNLLNKNFFDYNNSVAKSLFEQTTYPWEVLALIEGFIVKYAAQSGLDDFFCKENNILIHKTAQVAETAFIGANTIIGAGTEVRHGAYIRGNAIIGRNCVVGNSTEIKNALLFDCVQVPHYNYVGDSVLGDYAHLGAGVVASNQKSDKSLVTINYNGKILSTSLKKLGAIVSSNVEVGCNSVLSPGTVIGKNTNIYPLTMVRGFVPSNSIVKSSDVLVNKKTL